jgi:hypothetical protein
VAFPSQEAFRLLLREHLGPALRELGFIGSGSAYRLPLPNAIALLGFQRSRHNDRERVSFTVNLTAGPATAWEAARRAYPFLPERPAANTRYPGGLWHGRLGMQLPEPRDVWWELAPGTHPETLAAEVIDTIREHGMPALRAHAAAGARIAPSRE